MPASVDISIVKKRLMLKKPFILSNGTYVFRENVFFIIRSSRGEGIGEAPVVPYYGHTAEEVMKDLSGISAGDILKMMERGLDGDYGWDIPVQSMTARNAVETALLVWSAGVAGKTLNELLGAGTTDKCRVSYTVTGRTHEEMVSDINVHKSRIVKIKAGSYNDTSNIRRVRERFPDIDIRVDVNRGWSQEEVVNKFVQLEDLDIELIEEPVSGDLSCMEKAAEISSIPVFADESFRQAADLQKLAEKAPSVKGVVVKTAKAGGPLRALSLIRSAKKYGFEVMLSSMVESSLGVYSAGTLCPLCGYIDLDSPLLLKNDPFDMVSYNNNEMCIKDGLPAVPAEFRKNG